MSKEIFELPEHLDKVRQEEPIEQKKVQLEAVDKEEVKEEAVKEVKQKRVKKQIDDETRKLMIDRLQKSRKIKELTAETNELKEKLSKLETKEAEPVPIIKYDEPKVKKTITRKIKTIDKPVKEDEIVLKPLVEQKQILLEVPKIVHSTYRQPIW
jgi:chromosome segregation ATPase